jgi:hypothetical protein
MDRDGHIAEVDDQGNSFYIADSVEKRVEQLAIYETAADHNIEKLAGAHGNALAQTLGLVALPAPSDSHQRYWATPDFGIDKKEAILVRESREPPDYGLVERSDFTWVSSGTSKLSKMVLRAAKDLRLAKVVD